MTSYSDEEVKEAINGLGEFLDWARAQHLVSENSAWKESAKLIWAAEQYLKAKQVIEWYGDRMNYEMPLLTLSAEPLINEDEGQRAREFLNGR